MRCHSVSLDRFNDRRSLAYSVEIKFPGIARYPELTIKGTTNAKRSSALGTRVSGYAALLLRTRVPEAETVLALVSPFHGRLLSKGFHNKKGVSRLMILSEYDRRWIEVRFYQFCVDTYQMRRKTMDIINYADAICDLGNANKSRIRKIIQTMLNDTYYQSTKRDVILLSHLKGIGNTEIAEHLNMTRQGIRKYINNNMNQYTPIPRCGIDDDHEMLKFLNTLDTLGNIGRYGNGTIN